MLHTMLPVQQTCRTHDLKSDNNLFQGRSNYTVSRANKDTVLSDTKPSGGMAAPVAPEQFPGPFAVGPAPEVRWNFCLV